MGYLPPEGTYLAWLDFRALLGEGAHAAMLERARLGLSDGRAFGGYAGWLRLNFATGRPLLKEALERMERLVAALR